jgi:hypothetical protein
MIYLSLPVPTGEFTRDGRPKHRWSPPRQVTVADARPHPVARWVCGRTEWVKLGSYTEIKVML